MQCDNNKHLYILFGAGKIGRQMFKLIGQEKIFAFCDSAVDDQDRYLLGKPIIPLNRLKSYYALGNYTIVVASERIKNIAEMIQQLNELSIPYRMFDDIASEVIRTEADIYERMDPPPSFQYDEKYDYFISMDRFDMAGRVSSYLWQDLWAAKKIINERPLNHYDIGSRIDGFITHLLSSGINVTQLDIRKFSIDLPGLSFVQTDATELKEIENESIMSLSALCSLEHFGLGRYGDPIDPMACFNCFDAIGKKMMKNGILYISVPIGKEHLEFNAHRVFFASTIVKHFKMFELLEFSTCMNECFVEHDVLDKYDDVESERGDRFGLFRFKKK